MDLRMTAMKLSSAQHATRAQSGVQNEMPRRFRRNDALNTSLVTNSNLPPAYGVNVRSTPRHPPPCSGSSAPSTPRSSVNAIGEDAEGDQFEQSDSKDSDSEPLLKGEKSSKKRSNATQSSAVLRKRARMAYMDPPIFFLDPEDCFKNADPTENIKYIWKQYINVEVEGVIPAIVKEYILKELNTPFRTKLRVPNSSYHYLPNNKSNFSPSEVFIVWERGSDIFSSAKQYRRKNYTEPHLMAHVIHPILAIIHRLLKYRKDGFVRLETPDMTAVGICPNLVPTGDLNRDLNKKIDAAVSQRFKHDEEHILQRVIYNSAFPGINAIHGNFENFVPMFIFIEVKRPNEAKDPLIQLGAYASAEFSNASSRVKI